MWMLFPHKFKEIALFYFLPKLFLIENTFCSLIFNTFIFIIPKGINVTILFFINGGERSEQTNWYLQSCNRSTGKGWMGGKGSSHLEGQALKLRNEAPGRRRAKTMQRLSVQCLHECVHLLCSPLCLQSVP